MADKLSIECNTVDTIYKKKKNSNIKLNIINKYKNMRISSYTLNKDVE